MVKIFSIRVKYVTVIFLLSNPLNTLEYLKDMNRLHLFYDLHVLNFSIEIHFYIYRDKKKKKKNHVNTTVLISQ